MKNYLLWSVILLMAGAITSCSKEKTEGPIGPGEEGNAKLVIMQSNGPSGKAPVSPNETENPTTVESTLATQLAIYVFNEDDDLLEFGKSDMSYSGSTPGPYETSTFRLTTGPKQFYVFSNTPDLNGLWGQKYEDFEQQILDITFTGNLPSNIATNNEFAIGTLWRPLEPTQVDLTPAPGITNIPLNIGRLASKVTLETVTLGAATIEGRLPGAIVDDSEAWTLRAVPNKMYYVGQYDHNSVPPVPFVRNMPYVSAVHTEAPVTGTAQNPTFIHYADNANALGASLYAVENTSERKDDAWAASDAGHLYYGNTTHIQMSFVYTPVPAEIYQADNTAGGSISGTAFWTATFNGERRLYGVDPSAIAGVTEVWSHPDGRMYYNFPIRDRDEDGVDKQCRVLRNHSYRVAVDRVLNYGRNEENKDVPPITPIDEEDETDVHVTVTVLPWYLINQTEPL